MWNYMSTQWSFSMLLVHNKLIIDYFEFGGLDMHAKIDRSEYFMFASLLIWPDSSKPLNEKAYESSEQQRYNSACWSVSVLYGFSKVLTTTCYMSNFKILDRLCTCSWAGWFQWAPKTYFSWHGSNYIKEIFNYTDHIKHLLLQTEP